MKAQSSVEVVEAINEFRTRENQFENGNGDYHNLISMSSAIKEDTLLGKHFTVNVNSDGDEDYFFIVDETETKVLAVTATNYCEARGYTTEQWMSKKKVEKKISELYRFNSIFYKN